MNEESIWLVPLCALAGLHVTIGDTIPMNAGLSSLFSATSAADAYAQLAAVAGDPDALAAACKALTPRAFADATKHAPASGKPLLSQAAQVNAAPSVRVLLEARASPDVLDGSGASACFLAAQADSAETLQLLIQAGANIHTPRPSGATPVYIAAQQDARRSLAALLEAGGDPNAAKEGGFTPVSIACLRSRVECLGLLLSARADCDQAYAVADRFTPLMIAAHIGHSELLEVLLKAGASQRPRDSLGRTAREVALAEGQGLAASLLAAREHEDAREGAVMAQEATVQELKQMRPVQAELEVPSARLDALGTQIAQFGSQQSIFAAASQLQSSCTLIAQSLLPASRLAEQLAGLDTEAVELESSFESARAGLDAAQRRVASSSAAEEDAAVADRDAARERFVSVLGALQNNYETRQRHGQRHAETVAEARAAGATNAAAAPAPAAAEVPLPSAISRAVPVLRKVLTDVGEANRATLAAMDALSAAMAHELELMAQVQAPLRDAMGVCEVGIAQAAEQLLHDTPRDDLVQLQLLLGRVRAQQNAMEHSHALLLEGRRAAQVQEEADGVELDVADRIDELSMQISQAARRKEDAEVARLLSERDAAHEQIAAVRTASAEARSVLSDPILLEWYPEVRGRNGNAEKPATGRVDFSASLAAYDTLGEVVRTAARQAWRARPKPAGEPVLLSALELPRSAAFEAAIARVASVCETEEERGAPLLSVLLPRAIFYEREQPSVTYLLTPFDDYAENTTALAAWIRDHRGRTDALLPPQPASSPLATMLAPLLLAVAELHRHGITHGCLTPEAVRVRSGGSVVLSDICFPTAVAGREGGFPYTAPESANGEPSLPADCWSVGAILIELLTGGTPRWNATKSCLEDATTARPLGPPRPPPPGRLGHAWALAAGLTAADPAARLAMPAALRSPLFAALAPADALTPLAAACVPPMLLSAEELLAKTNGAPPAAMAMPVATGLGGAPLSAALFAEALPVAAAAVEVSDEMAAVMPVPVADVDADADAEAPDWLTAAAVDVGVNPLISPDAPPPAALPTQPIVEVLVSTSDENGGDADAALVRAVLDAASSLRPECDLRFTLATQSTVESHTADELMHRFFTAVGRDDLPPELRLWERADGGETYMPAASTATAAPPLDLLSSSPMDLLGGLQPTPPPTEALARFERVGKLLGYCALHGLLVALPLPAALFCALTGRTSLLAASKAAAHGTDINQSLAILGGFAPRAAVALRCTLARRAATGPALLAGVAASNKHDRAIERIEEELLGAHRAATLEALRAGLASMLGEAALAALTPSQLACRLLGGWQLSVRASDASAPFGREARTALFAFDPTDWEEPQLLSAYREWLVTWAGELAPAERVAFQLLAFGAAVGPPRRKRISCVASSEAKAIFLPEASLLWLPTAGSQQEFSARMGSSIALA